MQVLDEQTVMSWPVVLRHGSALSFGRIALQQVCSAAGAHASTQALPLADVGAVTSALRMFVWDIGGHNDNTRAL